MEKKELISSYLFENEGQFIRTISKNSNQPATEVVNFFVRRGLKDYQYTNAKQFSLDVAQLQVEAWAQTDEGKAVMAREVDKAIKNEGKKK